MFGSFAFLWKSVNNCMCVYHDKDDILSGLVTGTVVGLRNMIENEWRLLDIVQ